MSTPRRTQKSRRSRSRSQQRSQKRSQKSRRSRSRSRSQKRSQRRQHNQRGGMAEWSTTGDYSLIGPEARISAQIGSLDSAFAELPSVIPQRGGRKKMSRKRSLSRKRGLSRKRHHSRRQGQRGGMAPFGDTGITLTPAQYAVDGTNPQFRDEAGVNERYTAF